MIYPKIPRKSLALLLICLIFTLAAVGIMFIIYFFNTNNSLLVRPLLKKIYSEGEFHHHHQQQKQQQQQQQQQKQLDQPQYPKEHHQSNFPRYEKEIEGSFYEPYSGLEMHRKQLKYSIKDKKYMRNTYQHQQHDAGASDEFSDTIYIDDYDRFNDKIESEKIRNTPGNNPGEDDLLDINGIDYFETIILDHNARKNNGQMRGAEKSLPHALLKDEGGLSSKERDLLTFTKGLNQRRIRLNRIKGKKMKNNKLRPASGDDEAFDNETIGSGSGDFIDDTEADDEKQAQHQQQHMQQQQQQQQQIQLQRHGERARKHFKSNRRSGARKQQKNISPQFDIDNNNENLYSVSSEIISNLSNESTYKPAVAAASTYFGGGGSFVTSTTSSMSNMMPLMASSMQSISSQTSQTSSTEAKTNRINKLDKKPPFPSSSSLTSSSLTSSSLTSSSSSSPTGSVSNKKWMPPSVVSSREVVTSISNQSPESPSPRAIEEQHQNGAWLETRARRIMGNVKKSEERSRQLLLCEEAGGGELCRMLFKGHLNE